MMKGVAAMNDRIQVIRYKCCGKIFAGCREPECYMSVEFQRELRKHAKRGDIIEFVEAGECKFGKCECKPVKKIKQPELFAPAT